MLDTESKVSVRGGSKYLDEFRKEGNLVFLMPELAKIFPTTESVNAALSSLVLVARSAAGLPSRSAEWTTKLCGNNLRIALRATESGDTR